MTSPAIRAYSDGAIRRPSHPCRMPALSRAATRGALALVPGTGRLMPDSETDATDKQIAGLRRELKLTWDAHEREHRIHEAAHDTEHNFTQKAMDTAAVLAKENKADANEWRAAMMDRERKFATKDDVAAILDRLDKIERAGLVAAERETARIATDTEEKHASERRGSRGQWIVGLVVGLVATFSSILVNLVIRLTGPGSTP